MTYSGNTTQTKVDKIKDRESKVVINNKIRKNSKQNIDYTMDGSVKQLFLNLTKMQIPFNYEKTLEPLFPKEMKKDEHGNYYIKIGESKTMFCGHLDTYCYEYKKVWHVINDNIISTDGTTTLGGDDKAGITVMIKMIESNIPGLYYFFRGEEGVTSPTGTWGSKQALKSYTELFKTYDRCIAFDRKGNDSIITKQMYSDCCSTEFTNKLLEEFEKSGLFYRNDTTGMWCDSGVFMDLIPECTNISIGYKDEHTFNETQDIEHLENLVNACINTDWENLPVKRDPTVPTYDFGNYTNGTNYNRYDYGGYGGYSTKKETSIPTKFDVKSYKTMKELFSYVVQILRELDYECFNLETFTEGEEMYFQHRTNYEFLGLKIIDYDIYISSDETLRTYEYVGNIDDFENYVGVGESNDIEYQHLKTISSTPVSTKVENSDDYVFTKKQNDTFLSFCKNDKKSLSVVMNAITNNKKNELTSHEWLSVELAMISNDIIIDYNFHGINPDDFTDWVSLNWDTCKKILDTNTVKKSNDITEKTKEKLRSGMNNLFTTKQINTYTDICLNKIPRTISDFITQVIEKDLLDEDNENYQRYEKSAESWIINNGYKLTNEIDSDSFLDWLQYNYEDIKEYNG